MSVFLVLLILLGVSVAQEEAERILTQFERDYVLLKRGKFEFEENFTYAYYSANQVFLQGFAILDPIFLTLGRFGIERVRRHVFMNIITLRYGLRNHIQLEVGVPVVYRYEEGAVPEANEDRSAEKFGLGDVTFGFSYQPLRETKGRPALILSLGFKTRSGKGPFDIDPNTEVPTGTGFYALRGGLSFLKGLDPVVVFGGLIYTYNIPRKVNRLIVPSLVGGEPVFIERVDPGDTVTLNGGFAYALSYRFSLSMQYIQNFTMHTYVWTRGAGKRRAINSQFNTALLKIGTSWTLSHRTSLNFGISVGLTADSPDFILELRIPYRF